MICLLLNVEKIYLDLVQGLIASHIQKDGIGCTTITEKISVFLSN